MSIHSQNHGATETSADKADVQPALWAIFLELSKPRLAFLSTLSGVAGYLAAPNDFQTVEFLIVGIAIFLAAAGSLALNQVFERRVDAQMDRTKNRPLPAGEVKVGTAIGMGILSTLLGCGLAALTLPAISTILIVATVLIYVLIYTPLKRYSHWCTHIGAIPGALPPLIGWSAATNTMDGLGLWLFFILLLWQMPHFFAIAWLYREDYAKGGFKMLSVTHPGGTRLLAENYLYLLLLFPVCLGPVFLNYNGWIYGAASLLLNAIFLFEGIRFARSVRNGGSTGNRLFLFSLLYLPLLLIVLLFDRTYH